MRPAAAIAAALALMLGAHALESNSAHAITLQKGPPPVTMDVTETFLADWHAKLDDADLQDKAPDVVDVRNRLTVRLRRENLTFGARLDAALFANPPSTQFQNDVRLEELYLKARLGRWRLTAGDDYASLGRGMALSLRKVDDLGFDVSLRGAHAVWKAKKLSARVHAGLTNVVNVDGVDEKLVPDPLDLVLATRLEARPTPKIIMGAQFVDVERRHSDLLGSVSSLIPGGIDQDPIQNERFMRTMIAGGSLELKRMAKLLSIYLEANTLMNESERNTKDGFEQVDSDGLAVYGAATLFFDKTSLLIEAKHYDNFAMNSSLHPDTSSSEAITQTFPYIAPPTLERTDQRVVNNADVTGALLRLDHRLSEKRGRVFVSGALFQDAPIEHELTLHSYGGWEGRTQSGDRYLVQYGYRREWSPDEGLTRLNMVHCDLDAYILLKAGQDLQFHLNHEFRSKNPDSLSGTTGSDLADKYEEGTAYVTWTLAPHWSLTAQAEYITNAATRAKEDAFLGVPATFYPGAHVQYRFTQSTYVRLFAGRSKGGLKCSGGICRIFPEFEGAKLEATLRF